MDSVSSQCLGSWGSGLGLGPVSRQGLGPGSGPEHGLGPGSGPEHGLGSGQGPYCNIYNSTARFIPHSYTPHPLTNPYAHFLQPSQILILLGRAANIFPLSFLVNRFRTTKISSQMQFVMWFSGETCVTRMYSVCVCVCGGGYMCVGRFV